MERKETQIKIDDKTPLFGEKMRMAQKAAMANRWNEFKRIIIKEGKIDMLDKEWFDLFGNRVIHVASRSNEPELLKELLQMLPNKSNNRRRRAALRIKNLAQNTVLHEVIFCQKVEMADVVFKFDESPDEEVQEELNESTYEVEEESLLEITNNKGETPLFRAAKYGNLKMLKHLADYVAKHKVGDIGRHFHRRHFHRRADNFSALHASVIGQYFDVARWLVRMDEELAMEKDRHGFTCLQLLSKMPHVFRSHTRMGLVKNLIYYLLPEEECEIGDGDTHKLFRNGRDLESGQTDDMDMKSVISKINYSFWKCAKVFDPIDHLWKQKKKHRLAECLAATLVKFDLSWQISYNGPKKTMITMPSHPFNVATRRKQIELKRQERQRIIELKMQPIIKSERQRIESEGHRIESEGHQIESERQQIEPERQQIEPEKQENDQENIVEYITYNYTPLLIAASYGIEEIVEKILDVNPAAIYHVSKDEQNILHMAIKHRQLEIYRIIKRKKALKSVASRITREGRTILHQVARMDYYKAQELAGVAFQLQDELRWYDRVRKIVPDHYYMHCDEDGQTAGDVLEVEHDEMLGKAQKWLKETTQSCSTVAILVATVVFAAAYTIPGGSEGGTPVFLRSPIFLFFTIMDVVALATSLASVVMFLSILTSPCELWDFRKSLPRKLNLGFAFLFFALIATMMAFSATILLTIRLEWKKWTSTLVYSATFFPITVFGIIQFPVYVAAKSMVVRLGKRVKEVSWILIKCFKLLLYKLGLS